MSKGGQQAANSIQLRSLRTAGSTVIFGDTDLCIEPGLLLRVDSAEDEVEAVFERLLLGELG